MIISSLEALVNAEKVFNCADVLKLKKFTCGCKEATGAHRICINRQMRKRKTYHTIERKVHS